MSDSAFALAITPKIATTDTMLVTAMQDGPNWSLAMKVAAVNAGTARALLTHTKALRPCTAKMKTALSYVTRSMTHELNALVATAKIGPHAEHILPYGSLAVGEIGKSQDDMTMARAYLGTLLGKRDVLVGRPRRDARQASTGLVRR